MAKKLSKQSEIETNIVINNLIEQDRYRYGSLDNILSACDKANDANHKLTKEWRSIAEDRGKDIKTLREALSECLIKLKELGYTPDVKWNKIDMWDVNHEEEVEVEDPQFGSSC